MISNFLQQLLAATLYDQLFCSADSWIHFLNQVSCHRRTNDLRIFARIALASRFCNGVKSALMRRQSGHLPEPP